ncbi:MAG: LamG domain-containing protein [Bacteroidales bacterium]|nr:LamG domain-containing protein [Bacteroidales bacterium]
MKIKNLMNLHTLLLMLIVSSAMILGSCKKDEVGDKTALTTKIAEADALASAATIATYPQAAIDAFNTALASVKAASASTTLTQAEVDAQLSTLNAAIATFNSYGNASYAALYALIAECETLANAATADDYPQAAIDEFKDKIETVKTAFVALLTEVQINNLNINLTESRHTFDTQIYGYIDESLYLNAGWHFDEGTGTTATSFSTAAQVATFTKGWTTLLDADAALPTWIDGVKGGKAIYLDNGAHLEVPYSPSFLPADISISAWIKNDLQGWENNCIVSQNYWWGYKFATQSAGKPLFTERINATSVQDFDAVDGIVTPLVWTHVVVSLNSTTKELKFFINGVLAHKFTGEDNVGPLTQTLSFVDGTNTYTAQPFLIGSFATDAEIADKPDNFSWITTANVASFKGAIDELKIYNIALADGQVSRLYKVEKP